MLALLALDFDGVISDSAPEAFVVALRTYVALRPDSSLATESGVLSGSGAPSPAAVLGTRHYARFLELMPLGNRAEDFGVVLAALEAAATIRDQSDYDAYHQRQDAAWLRSFHQQFYRVRRGLADSDPEGWKRLMNPYAPLLRMLRRRAGDTVLAIATAKDRRSVRRLLHVYGIADLFAEDLVLDKETGVTKAAHMEHFQQRFGFAYADMTFVDDKVNHLDHVATLGVRCALAAWGFNGPREEALARDAGHLVCTLDDVESQIFGSSSSESP